MLRRKSEKPRTALTRMSQFAKNRRLNRPAAGDEVLHKLILGFSCDHVLQLLCEHKTLSRHEISLRCLGAGRQPDIIGVLLQDFRWRRGLGGGRSSTGEVARKVHSARGTLRAGWGWWACVDCQRDHFTASWR